jgi:hypothetical protein
LPGPMRPSGSRSIRKFSESSDLLDEAGISHPMCLEGKSRYLYYHFQRRFLSLTVPTKTGLATKCPAITVKGAALGPLIDKR